MSIIDPRHLLEPQAHTEENHSFLARKNGIDPSVGLTPTRLARLLRDAENGQWDDYLALAERMEEKDAQYLAVLGVRKRQVSQKHLHITPADDTNDAMQDAELVRQFINRMTIEDELFDMLDAVGKGYSVTEILWETSERQWMPTALKWMDPRLFVFKNHRLELGNHHESEALRPFQFITLSLRAKSGLPSRGGLARPMAWIYLFKNFSIRGWLEFAEIYGQPLRLGRYHNGASEEEKRTLLRAVAGISRDAAAIIPESMSIEFASANARGSGELYENLASYMDRQISKLVLGQTSTIDAISGGHAVGQEHDKVRQDIMRADARQLEATLNQQLIRPLVMLNHGARASYPRLIIEDDTNERPNWDVLSKALERLVPLGLQVSEQEVRSMLGLSRPKEGDALLGKSHDKPAPTR